MAKSQITLEIKLADDAVAALRQVLRLVHPDGPMHDRWCPAWSARDEPGGPTAGDCRCKMFERSSELESLLGFDPWSGEGDGDALALQRARADRLERLLIAVIRSEWESSDMGPRLDADDMEAAEGKRLRIETGVGVTWLYVDEEAGPTEGA